MKVKIIRDTVANKTAVFVGEIHDLPEAEAKYLIAIGKAEEVSAPPSESPAREVIETADAVHSDIEQAVKPRAKKKE